MPNLQLTKNLANDINVTPTLSPPSNRPNQLGAFAGLVVGGIKI